MSESPGLTLSCEPNHHLSKEASVTVLSMWGVVTVTHYQRTVDWSPVRTSVSKQLWYITMNCYSHIMECSLLHEKQFSAIRSYSETLSSISRQEYWQGLPFPYSEDLPTQGSNLCLQCLLYWQAGSLWVPPGKLPQRLGEGYPISCSQHQGWNYDWELKTSANAECVLCARQYKHSSE